MVGKILGRSVDVGISITSFSLEVRLERRDRREETFERKTGLIILVLE